MKNAIAITLILAVLGMATLIIISASQNVAAVDPIDPLAPKYTAIVGPPPMTVKA